MAMRTLTYHVATQTSRDGGRPRSIAVSLPFVTCIADDEHYTAPPAPPPIDYYAPAMTDRAIRKALSKDPERNPRLRRQAIMRDGE